MEFKTRRITLTNQEASVVTRADKNSSMTEISGAGHIHFTHRQASHHQHSFHHSAKSMCNRVRTNPNYFGVEFRCKDGRLRSTYIQIEPDKIKNPPFVVNSLSRQDDSFNYHHNPQLPSHCQLDNQSDSAISTAEPLSRMQNKQKRNSTAQGLLIRSGFSKHRKKRPNLELITWSKDRLSQPLIDVKNKHLRKVAITCFDHILTYMGDKSTSDTNLKTTQENRPEVEIVYAGWNFVSLRNEIYMQLIKQTTNNTNLNSLNKGLELIAICLNFFSPCATYRSLLEAHIKNCINAESSMWTFHCTTACLQRLNKMCQEGLKNVYKNPTLYEVQYSKRMIYHTSMFGTSLIELMNIQKAYLPNDSIPWILALLSNEVLRLNGAQTEGIFRIPGDVDKVHALKAKCDQWNHLLDRKLLVSILSSNTDPHIPASLLKLWYRELPTPLIPNDVYSICINVVHNSRLNIYWSFFHSTRIYDRSNDPAMCVATVQNSIPVPNRRVLIYLIRYLQIFARPHNVAVTKMDVNNLALVIAPNCFRCPSNDPNEIVENAAKEMQFFRSLLLYLPQHCEGDESSTESSGTGPGASISHHDDIHYNEKRDSALSSLGTQKIARL